MTEQTPAETAAARRRSARSPGDRSAQPAFRPDKLRRGVGIRFKGVQRTNVEEYCISQGWVRVQAGKTMDRHGRPLTIQADRPGRGVGRGPRRRRSGGRT
jgi:hypothetical protein